MKNSLERSQAYLSTASVMNNKKASNTYKFRLVSNFEFFRHFYSQWLSKMFV